MPEILKSSKSRTVLSLKGSVTSESRTCDKMQHHRMIIFLLVLSYTTISKSSNTFKTKGVQTPHSKDLPLGKCQHKIVVLIHYTSFQKFSYLAKAQCGWLGRWYVCRVALRVHLSAITGNGWLHIAPRCHKPMPISCHFHDCKALTFKDLSPKSHCLLFALAQPLP